uniref:Uncharacterized protein n=1 Tax=Aegilops tauschii subsp. strangulata TaxID=200361 RepID=A0A453RHF8_AEGTS
HPPPSQPTTDGVCVAFSPLTPPNKTLSSAFASKPPPPNSSRRRYSSSAPLASAGRRRRRGPALICFGVRNPSFFSIVSSARREQSAHALPCAIDD